MWAGGRRGICSTACMYYWSIGSREVMFEPNMARLAALVALLLSICWRFQVNSKPSEQDLEREKLAVKQIFVLTLGWQHRRKRSLKLNNLLYHSQPWSTYHQCQKGLYAGELDIHVSPSISTRYNTPHGNEPSGPPTTIYLHTYTYVYCLLRSGNESDRIGMYI